MKRTRHGLFSLIADWVIRLAGAPRSGEPSVEQLRQADYRTNTRGMGLRMGAFLRDRLRRGWLRIRRGD